MHAAKLDSGPLPAVMASPPIRVSDSFFAFSSSSESALESCPEPRSRRVSPSQHHQTKHVIVNTETWSNFLSDFLSSRFKKITKRSNTVQVELDCVRVASWRRCVFLLKQKNLSPQAQSTAAQEVMHHMLWEGRKLRIIDGGLKKQFAGSKAQIKVLKLLCVFSLQRKEAIILLPGVRRQGGGCQHATRVVLQYVHIYTVRIPRLTVSLIR